VSELDVDAQERNQAAGAVFLDAVAKAVFTGIAVGGDASSWEAMTDGKKAFCMNVAQDVMEVVEPALMHVAGQSAISALEELAAAVTPDSNWSTIRYQFIPDFIAALKEGRQSA